MRYSPFIILLLSLFFACQEQEEVMEEYSHNIFSCENEELLFSLVDSVPIFSIDYSLDNDSMINFVSQQLGNKECQYEVTFGLKLTDGNTIPILTDIPCDFEPMLCGIYSNNIEILINDRNQILIESEYVTIDSLDSFIDSILQYELSFNDDYINISLYWDTEADADVIENILIEAQKSIIPTYQSISLSLFEKDICALNQNELEELSNEFDFYIKIKNFEGYPPILTLPPIPK